MPTPYGSDWQDQPEKPGTVRFPLELPPYLYIFLFVVSVFPQFSISLVDDLKGKTSPEEMKLFFKW